MGGRGVGGRGDSRAHASRPHATDMSRSQAASALIEMEERGGGSKRPQMTRWKWIGSRALVMSLRLHLTAGGRQMEPPQCGSCGADGD